MEDEPKKISFGFSKLSKKTSIISSKLTKNTKPEENEKEFIVGFESNSIKLKDPIKTEEKVLVIPLKKPPDTVENPPSQNASQVDESTSDKLPETLIQDNKDCLSSVVEGFNSSVTVNDLKTPSIQQTPMTLDELAAKEILDDLNREKTKSDAKVVSVPLSNSTSTGEKESTLDDYENVPVGEFGVAMLRGMGWAPGKGIGKNEKLVVPPLPPVRPKGMGLGADKVIKMPNSNKSKTDTDDDLKTVVGSFIKVKIGQNKDCYGKIEAFEESGRAIVKLAVNNQTVSLYEFMFDLVDSKEYNEKSKIVNLCKYEQYKKAEEMNESFETMLSKRSSRSRSPDETENSKNNYSSQSMSSSRNRHSSSKRHGQYKPDKTREKCRGRSSSSDKSSSSTSDYSRKTHRTKKKKPSSHRLKSRSRSRSPRKHKKHKRR